MLEGVLRDFTSQASDMYKEAHEHTKSKYNTIIGKSAESYDRHWLANERLYELALNYDDAKPEIKFNGKNSYYTRIEQENVVITISQVKTADTLVRGAKFRNNLASLYGQNLSLFEPKPIFRLPNSTDKLYIVVLHGAISSKENNLGFVNVAIPDDNLENYSYNRCLFELCGLKHPFKLNESNVERIQRTETVKLKSKLE